MLSAPDVSLGVPGVFNLVRCSRCGLVYENPRPTSESLDIIYPESYAPHQDLRGPGVGPPLARWGWKVGQVAAPLFFRRLQSSDSGVGGLRARSSYVLATLLQLPVLPPAWTGADGASRLLDIGCGTGRFLAQMLSAGWDAYGVEVDREAAERARRIAGERVLAGAFEPGLFTPGSFDLITLGHVLEHLSSPSRALSEVAQLLKPGGWLAIEVPNMNSLEARVLGGHAYQLELPRHFYHFTAETLSMMLEKATLRPVRTLFPIEPTSLYVSLRRKLGYNDQQGWGTGHIWRRRLLWPLCALLSWTGTGSQMAVLATKPSEKT